MMRQLVGSAAMAGALLSTAAFPAGADPDPTPPPYCAGTSSGDQIAGGATCNDELTDLPAAEEPVDDNGTDDGNGSGGGNGPGGGTAWGLRTGGGNGPDAVGAPAAATDLAATTDLAAAADPAAGRDKSRAGR